MSVKTAFEGTVKSFCSDVTHQISEWLSKNKGVEVSAEELSAALECPFKTPSTPGMNGSSVQTVLPNVMPSYFSSTESPSATGAKKRGGRTKKVVDPSLPGCVYKTTRGKTPGTQCPNRVAGGSVPGGDRYCTACLKKTSVQKDIAESAPSSTVQPPQLPGSAVSIEPSVSEPPPELTVTEIPDRPGWFREGVHNFLVQQIDEGTVLCHSVFNSNGTQRNLTEPEKKIATAMGLSIVTPTVSIPLPTIPKTSLPAIPTIPNVQLPPH